MVDLQAFSLEPFRTFRVLGPEGARLLRRRWKLYVMCALNATSETE